MLIQAFKTGFICKYIYLGITLKKIIVKYAILKKSISVKCLSPLKYKASFSMHFTATQQCGDRHEILTILTDRSHRFLKSLLSEK